MLERLKLALKAVNSGEVSYDSQEFENMLLTVIAQSIATIAEIYMEKNNYKLHKNDD